MRILGAILALAAPAGAAAQCLTRADLQAGIAVVSADRSVDIFTAEPGVPGAIRWRGEFEGMDLGTALLGQGFIYLESLGPATSGLKVTYDYDMLPADLPIPRPGGAWEGVAVVTSGDQSSTERQTHHYAMSGSITVGECNWSVVPVRIDYPGGADDLYYFTDLGISLRMGARIEAILPLAQLP